LISVPVPPPPPTKNTPTPPPPNTPPPPPPPHPPPLFFFEDIVNAPPWVMEPFLSLPLSPGSDLLIGSSFSPSFLFRPRACPRVGRVRPFQGLHLESWGPLFTTRSVFGFAFFFPDLRFFPFFSLRSGLSSRTILRLIAATSLAESNRIYDPFFILLFSSLLAALLFAAVCRCSETFITKMFGAIIFRCFRPCPLPQYPLPRFSPLGPWPFHVSSPCKSTREDLFHCASFSPSFLAPFLLHH